MNKSYKFDKVLQDLANYSRVMSHPARLPILKILAQSKFSAAGDIADFIPLSRTTVSQHLSELRRSGLISSRTDGLNIIYSLNHKEIKKYNKSIKKYFALIRESSDTDTAG